jgi:Flp pilus assembly protein TadB
VIAVAVAGVVAFLSGACLLLSALSPVERKPRPRRAQRQAPIDRRRLAFAVAGAGLAALLTRWPVAALGGAALGWWGPDLLRPSSDSSAEERTEAIASWCELLRDAAGTSRGIEGMLVATASSAPGPIRDEAQQLARRLEFEPIGTALDRLADDLDHPLGDLVVTALRLASTAGARRVRDVLDDLARAAHLEAAMQRRLDVARQRPRSTMRLVAGIVTAFVTGMVLLARRYLAPYGTPVGQVVLVVIAGYWALGFWWMDRMGRVPQVPRFLAARSVDRP